MAKERLHFAMPRRVPKGLWRRVPPAIFPPILGGLALALAWQGGVSAFSLPSALAQIFAGMMVATAVFCLVAYAGKLARRPSVLPEELTILPGRAGVSAAVLSIYLLAALTGGRVLLVLGMALHLVMLVVLIRVFLSGPPEQRRVTPIWHLHFTSLIVAARAAIVVGWEGFAAISFWAALIPMLAIYAASIRQALAEKMPPPLRPMFAVHIAPLALFAMVALGLGWGVIGKAFAWLCLAAVLLVAARARWVLDEGFSPFWGALTFPISATAGAWISLWRLDPTELHRFIAGVLLIAATLIVLPILFAVLKSWAQGRLPVKTNAAIA